MVRKQHKVIKVMIATIKRNMPGSRTRSHTRQWTQRMVNGVGDLIPEIRPMRSWHSGQAIDVLRRRFSLQLIFSEQDGF